MGGRRQDVVRRRGPSALAARLRRLLARLPARAPAPVSRGRRRRPRRDPLAAQARAGRFVPHRSQEDRRVRLVGGRAPGGPARHPRPRLAHEGFAYQRRDLVFGPDGLHDRERHLLVGDGHDQRARLPRVRAGRSRMSRHRGGGVADHLRRQERRADAARELRRRVGARRPGDPHGRRAHRRRGGAPDHRVPRHPPRRCVPARRLGRHGRVPGALPRHTGRRPPDDVSRSDDHRSHHQSALGAGRARGHVRRVVRRPLRGGGAHGDRPTRRRSRDRRAGEGLRGPARGLPERSTP